MKLKSSIYISKEDSNPRFVNQDGIQKELVAICKKWKKYLQLYVNRTGEFLANPECPWENTERAIVSTLSAAISRYYRESIVLEESRVLKPGNNWKSEAKRPRSWGRCDLWVSMRGISAGPSSFNFYLEAKTSHRRSADGLGDFLRRRYGISKIFRDYLKSNKKGRLDQRSSYRKARKHEHYVIGLLVTPLHGKEIEFKEVKAELRDAFESRLQLDLRRRVTEAEKKNARRMQRFPTVALILRDQDGAHPGMVASFTVLGASKGLGKRKNGIAEALV